jgi:TniQ protein
MNQADRHQDRQAVPQRAGRSLPSRPAKTRPNRWGSTTYFDRWLFTRSTRYCPACLAGDDTELGRALGGAWRRTWWLPVVFACTEHRRYLDHQCPACHQPVHVRRGNAGRRPSPVGHPQPALHAMPVRRRRRRTRGGAHRLRRVAFRAPPTNRPARCPS